MSSLFWSKLAYWFSAELARFAELLELYYKEHRDTVFYAQKMGRNLNGPVKMTFGKSVYGVVMDRMMLEKEVLLVETDMALKEVTYGAGFSELSYFSTYFKREKGMIPDEFREKNKEVEGKP